MDRYKFYVWSLTSLTLISFFWLLDLGTFPSFSTLLFWVPLVMAVYLLPVSLGYGTEVTMGIPINLALAILFPPSAAMLIAGVGSFDNRELKREISIHQAVFNRVQLMLAVGATSLVIYLSKAEVFQAGELHIGTWGAVAIGAAAIIHVVVNLGLVACAVHLQRRVPILKAFAGLLPDPAAGFWISYVILTCFGVVSALAYDRFGGFAVAAMLIPVLFARLSLLGARAQQELSERVQKQQEALLAATEKVFQERENERKRIAEDIHDSSLQLLAAATYGIGNAEEFLGTGRDDLAAEAIVGARDAVEGAIKDLRASLVDLRRSSIEEGGLLETITKFADQVSTVWAAQVVIKGNVAHEPPIPVALAAFQILQESLINAMKHAQGSTVTVEIEDGDGQFHIVVADDGPGFDPEDEVGEDHVGMRLMKERAARVGGRIVLNSAPGNGTRLEAILPGGVGQ